MHSDTIILLGMQVLIIGFITESFTVFAIFTVLLLMYAYALRDEIEWRKKIETKLRTNKYKPKEK